MDPSSKPHKVAWLWADKVVLRRIRDQVPDVSSALGVYFALCEVASDTESPSFEVTQEAIASKCGLGVRTVGARLHDLKSVGAIKMEVPPIRSKARFELLDPFGNGCRSIGSKCGSFGNGSVRPLPISNSIEELRTKPLPEAGDGSGSKDQQEKRPTTAKPPKPRERNLLLDALVEACHGNLLETTESAMQAAAVALADIRKASPALTAQEIHARAGAYHRKHPTWSLTPNALGKHWGTLGSAAEVVDDIDEDLRKAMR